MDTAVSPLDTMDREVSELSVPVPWGKISGKVWGPDQGRPVLCLHGWADNCGSFNTLIPLLPKEYRYIVLDLAGHGHSSHRPPGAYYTMPAYVSDVLRVTDALKLKRFSIMGHSMGAIIAARFTALYPEMVDALVLLDSYGFLPNDITDMPKLFRRGMEQMTQFEKKGGEKERKVYAYEEAVSRLLAADPTLSEQSVHILLQRGLQQVDGGFAFSRDLRVNFVHFDPFPLELSQAMMSRIQVPLLVILAEGSLDKRVGRPSQKKCIEPLLQQYQGRNDKVVTVPGHHYVHLNNPELISPLVTDYLQTQGSTQLFFNVGLTQTP